MKHWNILEKKEIKTIDEIVEVLLQNRKITTPEERATFIEPKLESVTFKNVGIDEKQVTKTVKRLTKAIEMKEQIVVYGDYDVDGITGSAILWETLYRLGANVLPYIPHRVDEGYGLSKKGITNVKTQMLDVRIIITVDNGIVASEAVDFANEQGLEVIITDHHVMANDAAMPKAFAIVHTTQLCGAGVAWLLSQELRQKASHPVIPAKAGIHADRSPIGVGDDKMGDDDHLELAALGTIADLVPLTGANRTIVKYGLKKLQETKRKGLLSLYEEAGIEPNAIGVYQVGHQIAPRLNATGRMENAMDSLRLLCTKDENRARELAGSLGRINRERQLVMSQATEHASTMVSKRKELKKLLIVAHETYPEGVIGLVAGRLVEEHYRPAIVIAKGEKTSKGSVRSVNGFNIIEFLRESSEHFVNVGGHPMAAGFTVETEKLVLLQRILEDMAEELLTDETLIRSLKIDMTLPFSSISPELYLSLQQLAPFGMGNPEPTFVSKNVEIKDSRLLGKEGKHMRLMLQQDFGTIMEAVAFGMGELYSSLAKGELVDVAYTIDENTWNGNTKLQLKIKDIKKMK